MIDRVAAWIRDAEHVTVLTGAGISAESGVPVFRGATGLWRQFRPEELATPDAFARQPEVVWEWYLWRRERIAGAEPNEGHRTIARWQQTRGGVSLLTQNVDGLHARACLDPSTGSGSPRATSRRERAQRGERAGSSPPVELHGNLWRVRCAAGCGFRARDIETDAPRRELRCRCGAWLRPEVIWFGEPLDGYVMDEASAAIERADVVLVVGTSAVVYPVAGLPHRAKRRGARVVEVNVDDTPLTPEVDAVLRGPAGEMLPAVERAL
jgi:NAD-dependent deacetylase